MKSSVSPALRAFLLSTAGLTCYKADLYTITLTDGTVLYATNGQMPITFGGNIFSPGGVGNWQRGQITTSLGLDSSQMDLTCSADSLTLVPGRPCSILQGMQLGLFDNATIRVDTVYMPTYNANFADVSLGSEIKYIGNLTQPKIIGRTKAEWECQSYLFMLNQQMPRVLFQPSCHWQLFDAGCTINKGAFTFLEIAANGSNQSLLIPSTPFSQPDGYFTQGSLTFISGQNVRLSATVKTHVDGQLQLNVPLLFPVLAGDSFQLSAGCDRTFGTCQSKFSNQINFGGQPYIPDPTTAIAS